MRKSFPIQKWFVKWLNFDKCSFVQVKFSKRVFLNLLIEVILPNVVLYKMSNFYKCTIFELYFKETFCKSKTYFDLWSCSERSWSNIKIGMLSVMLFSSKTGAKVFLKPILMSQLSKSFFQILFPRVRRRRWGHWPFWRYWRFWCFGGRSSDSNIGIVWIPENKSHVS